MRTLARTYCFPNNIFYLHGEVPQPCHLAKQENSPRSVLVAAADKESGERSGTENIKEVRSMKRYGDIYDKICTIENLREAHRNARKDKLFYKEVKMVDADPDKYLYQIQEMLISGTYEVSDYALSIINDKGKERELAKLPYFPDRIIQWAIMLQIEPIFLKVFCPHTCASIPGRGISKAQELLHGYLKDVPGTQYCLKIDVSKFYPNIDHEILKRLLERKFKDKRLLQLLFKIVDSVPEKGVPIGSYLSQYLANFYLAYFDHWMKETLRLKYVVRYMDDVIVLSDSKEHLHEVRRQMDEYLQNELNLHLKPNYQVFPVDARGVDFIGFRSFHGYTLLRKRTAVKFKARMNKIQRKQDAGKLISFSEWCSANSYRGWLEMCDGFRLKEKYLTPIQPSLDKYYNVVIIPQKQARKREKKERLKAA